MREVVPLRGAFADWTVEQTSELINHLLPVLRESSRLGTKVFLFSVEMNAYRTWKRVMPLPKPERFCATWCFYRAIETYLDSNQAIVGPIDCFVDQGEPYLKHIDNDWRRKDFKRKWPVLHLVRSVGAANMKQTPALQIADMLAWARNRLLSNAFGRYLSIATDVLVSHDHKRVVVDDRQLLEQLGWIQV